MPVGAGGSGRRGEVREGRVALPGRRRPSPIAWLARAGRLREIPSVLSSDAFLDEMRRFLPARMLVATVESLSWREYASQAVTGLYDPSGPAWASPYGSPGFGRPMPEPDQSSAVPMWRDGGPALS